jgi:RND superfamily putative drug exporter
MPTDQAVERGIRTTASAVTIALFAIVASLCTLDVEQIGFGLGVAVFIGATLIRGVLLPAAMSLLADWNWYLVRWLEWMPGRPIYQVPGNRLSWWRRSCSQE